MSDERTGIPAELFEVLSENEMAERIFAVLPHRTRTSTCAGSVRRNAPRPVVVGSLRRRRWWWIGTRRPVAAECPRRLVAMAKGGRGPTSLLSR
mgnify:FL=1